MTIWMNGIIKSPHPALMEYAYNKDRSDLSDL